MSFQIKKKLTPFQRQKEEEEQRKRKADAETKAVFDDFVATFSADRPAQTFVRGETINPNGPTDEPGNRNGARTEYIPPGNVTSKTASSSRETPSPKRPKTNTRTKVRALDAFMEELKEEQERRENRRARNLPEDDSHYRRRDRGRDRGRDGDYDRERDRERGRDRRDDSSSYGGNHDHGDPQSTNIYIGNLDPLVEEEELLKLFARFGPIASVKIMWPRTEEERMRGRNCGFVAFMTREDAAAAKNALDGFMFGKNDLRLGWGQKIAVPAKPYFDPGNDFKGHKEAREGLAQMNRSNAFGAASHRPDEKISKASSYPEPERHPTVDDIVVPVPLSAHKIFVIDTLAKYVAKDGFALESAILHREKQRVASGERSELDFLLNDNLPESKFYRWRLFSLACGDELDNYRLEAFKMLSNQGRWIPPNPREVARITEGAGSAEKPLSSNKDLPKAPSLDAKIGFGADAPPDKLDNALREEFRDLLSYATLSRQSVKKCMAFAMSHTNAPEDIASTMTDSLLEEDVDAPAKVARLYVLSDVFQNTAFPSNQEVKGLTTLRSALQSRIPSVFEALNHTYRTKCAGRLMAEDMKQRVLRVLQSWSEVYLFTEQFICGLECTLIRSRIFGAPFEKKHLGEAFEGYKGQSIRDLERQCKTKGLDISQGQDAMAWRLTEWEDFLESKRQETDTPAAFKDNSAPRRQSGGSSLPASSRFANSENTGIERPKQKSRWETEDFD